MSSPTRRRAARRSPLRQAAAALSSVGNTPRNEAWWVGTIAYWSTTRRSRSVASAVRGPQYAQNDAAAHTWPGGRAAARSPSRTCARRLATSPGGVR
jgi:hypothetical protein